MKSVLSFFSRKNLSLVLVVLYLFNAIFLPNDTFFVKKASFLLVLLINADVIVKKLFSFKELPLEEKSVFVFALFLPIYTILKSIILTGNVLENIMIGYSGAILLLFFIVDAYDIDFSNLFIIISVSLSFFIILIVLLDYINFLSIYSNPVVEWMNNTENSFISKSSYNLFDYYIFIKTSPLLIMTVGLLIDRRKYLLSLIVLFALFLSGTRGNFLFGLLTFIVGLLSMKEKKQRLIVISFLVIVLVYVFIIRGVFSSFVALTKFKSSGDNYKITTAKIIFDTWKNNPLSFFIGQGYSSTFYNYVIDQWISETEISYFNLLRRVGVFCFVLMMYGFFKPFITSVKNRSITPAIVGYVAYFMGAFFNPLLYYSTGITVLLSAYVYVYIDKRPNSLEVST